MKNNRVILAAFVAGVSFSALAVEPPPAPAITAAGVAPSLFPSEQGAFKLMEAAAQIVESNIVQNGCVTKDYPIVVNTDYDGSGSAVLGGVDPKNTVNLNVLLKSASTANGRAYTVNADGQIAGLAVALNGTSGGSFNIGSSIQEMSNNWTLVSPQTGLSDKFTGTIIKDYKRLTALDAIPAGFDDAGVPVSTVLDYGYQQVGKNGYVKAKYWQQSRTWREDGVNSGTYWAKTRVAPTNGCTVEFKLEGYGLDPADNIEGFNEMGTVHVGGKAVGPFKMQ
jgi:hypothetical protein